MPRSYEQNRSQSAIRSVWRYLRPFLVLALSAAIVCGGFYYGVKYTLNKYVTAVDSSDATPASVVIDKNDTASKVAEKLYAAFGAGRPGVIANKAVFKIYVDFVGKANKLKSGTYVLSRNMDIPEIVDVLCEGNPSTVITFTVQEGYTISGVLWSLEQKGMKVDEQAFLNLCNDKTAFSNFQFIEQLQLDPKKPRDYLLQGYLFPDTYKVRTDATPQDIINTMLVRFNVIFTSEDIARAKELGMSIDDVVTLASVIEREASVKEDFYKVSAVFHNRLKAGEPLGSCATLQYVLKQNKYVYSDTEKATDSPYNTYKYAGLPAGPICNPGRLAIDAALHPNEEYLKEGYFYFCNMDLPKNKALIFAKTAQEHAANIAKYSKYWS